MPRTWHIHVVWGGLLLLGLATAAEVDPAAKILARIKAVGTEGNGNQDAAVAWKELVNLGQEALFPIFDSMSDVKPTVENWLRTAVGAIAEKEKKAKKALPQEKLESYVKELKNPPLGRRLAYELLVQEDPKTPERLLNKMLDDPSIDLRRDAIAQALEKIKKDDPDAGKKYAALFPLTRDQDQAELVANALKKLGTDVDLTDHFNVIWKWMVVGPFDSPKGAGYGKPFEPEEKVDLAATYKGKGGKELKWSSFWTFDTYGKLELNDALGKHKDAVGYAFAAIDSPEERSVELRLGCIVSSELFLNGKKVFAREEYHHGDRLDQYVGHGTLKKGRNEILVKVLQNNQTEPWAQSWTFQLRVCDFTGGKVPFKMLTGE